MKKYFYLALCLILCFVFITACGNDSAAPGAVTNLTQSQEIPAETTPEPEPTTEPEPELTPEPEPPVEFNLGSLPVSIPGTIMMENGREIKFELYPNVAPQAVFNFIYLARDGFYDGLKFHRIMSGFMIQGGCPNSADGVDGLVGTGNPGWSILGEFASNGIENDIAHVPGVLSMARGPDYNSAGSQFFIVHGNAAFLDRDYAGFGRVTEGMDVVDLIAATPNNGPNGSVDPALMPTITSITIDSDIVVPAPDKIMR